ncbi:jg1559 [Pararge aegeria aegeria]|uniref:Jg1559 protein n=1 Tax=Pararge aegeria aegeria TaxID=348720 RepID=A0A8S4QMH6_9NEOP|nr:jg1559 [Pararge aegeria aegeria]
MHGGATSSASRSDDSDGEEASALEQELQLDDPDAPARTLAALNALRKARQHYDVLLAAAGEEVGRIISAASLLITKE